MTFFIQGLLSKLLLLYFRGFFVTRLRSEKLVAFINPHRACASRVTVVVLCVCLSVYVSTFCILLSRTFRRPTRGISGYSAENAAKNKKPFSLKLLSLEVRSVINLPRLQKVSHFLHRQCFRIPLCNTYAIVMCDYITWSSFSV